MAKNHGSRAKAGQILINHKGVKIPTSVGSHMYEREYGGNMELKFFPRTEGKIPFGFNHRPELISNLFLNKPSLWWLVCERNSIFDVFEQLNAGDPIDIPIEI
tara:strand:- start:192 stop:500 length:309 start_codon:yes stop_codon:yes gene_type:complete